MKWNYKIKYPNETIRDSYLAVKELSGKSIKIERFEHLAFEFYQIDDNFKLKNILCQNSKIKYIDYFIFREISSNFNEIKKFALIPSHYVHSLITNFSKEILKPWFLIKIFPDKKISITYKDSDEQFLRIDVEEQKKRLTGVVL